METETQGKQENLPNGVCRVSVALDPRRVLILAAGLLDLADRCLVALEWLFKRAPLLLLLLILMLMLILIV
jgi:hypothetical protein